MNRMINFDSSDWNSIRDTIDKINETGCPQLGETEDLETIIFAVINNDGDHDVLETTVFQHNGWMRINEYDPTDYTITEMYKKES